MNIDEMNVGSVLKGKVVQAKYLKSLNPLYCYNAFIEALPPLLTAAAAVKKMRRIPVYHEDMRSWPDLQRIDQVMSIFHLIVPLPDHLLMEQSISRIIRNGYMCRNPLKAMWVKQINSGFEDLDVEDDESLPVIRSNASGFAIVGPSGSGKSTTIESVLMIYPQVIVHSNYLGTKFPHEQVVWLKLECPSNASTRALCVSFFTALDEILGTTEYGKEYARKGITKEDMVPIMARLAALHGLGVLVIDELQRLNAAASGGHEEMMYFFTELNNRLGIPVVLIGTSAALNLVTEKFSQARRFTGQGDGIWSPMAHDASWDHFLESMWKYQFTNLPTPLTEALNAEMYNQTCGIIDLAVKLYMLVQWSVIGRTKGKKEGITPKLIRSVAKDKFKFVTPALNKFRNGSIDNPQYLDDLLPSRELLKDVLAEAKNRIALGATLNTISNQRTNDSKDGNDRLLMKLASLLVMASYPDKIAETAARHALDRHAEELDFTLVSQEAMKVAAELKAEEDAQAQRQNCSRVKRQKRTDQPQNQSGDLRDTTKVKEVSPHTALKNSGDIKDIDELCVGEELA